MSIKILDRVSVRNLTTSPLDFARRHAPRGLAACKSRGQPVAPAGTSPEFRQSFAVGAKHGLTVHVFDSGVPAALASCVVVGALGGPGGSIG